MKLYDLLHLLSH